MRMTQEHICTEVEPKDEKKKARTIGLVMATIMLGYRGEAGVIPYILPTGSGIAIEPSSVRYSAAETVDQRTCLQNFMLGQVGWH